MVGSESTRLPARRLADGCGPPAKQLAQQGHGSKRACSRLPRRATTTVQNHVRWPSSPRQKLADLEPTLGPTVVSSNWGYRWGSDTLLETARALSARNIPARCLADCSQETLHELSKHHFRSIIFIRNLPRSMHGLQMLRGAACSLLLDTLDLSSIWHKNSCSDRKMLQLLDGAIANNRVSRARIAGDCPELARKPVFLIEHFHSATRRV